MGLRNVIQNAVKTAVNSGVGDIAESITYIHKGTSSRDPETREVTASNVEDQIKAVVESFTAREFENMAIKSSDVKLIIPTLSLTDHPKTSDKVAREDGTIWDVVDYMTDPAKGAWIVAIRGK